MQDTPPATKSFAQNTELILSELTLQRTNCLSTLQRQGSAQLVLLEKMLDVLQAIRNEKAEVNQILKAK